MSATPSLDVHMTCDGCGGVFERLHEVPVSVGVTRSGVASGDWVCEDCHPSEEPPTRRYGHAPEVRR